MAQGLSEKIAEYCIRKRLHLVSAFLLLTAVLLIPSMRVDVKTVFADLLPMHHPFVQVHEQYKDSYGGANIVSIMVRATEGDIFRYGILKKIQGITRDLRTVSGVNEFQIVSIAARKIKVVTAGTHGIAATPLMWPDVPDSQAELDALRETVVSSPMVYGIFVSRDLSAALISVDFVDERMQCRIVCDEIYAILGTYSDASVDISIIGEPVLQGHVERFLPETLMLFFASIALFGFLLYVFFMRSWWGTAIPLFSVLLSTIWALGIASLLGIDASPLGIVIAFLISAQVISYSVQAINRFDIVHAGNVSIAGAAQRSLGSLFRPGMLSVVTDAGCKLVVALTPIVFLQKSSFIGSIWLLCIALTGVLLTPVLLSWLPHADTFNRQISFTHGIDYALSLCTTIALSGWRYVVLGATAMVLTVCIFLSSDLVVGDVHPGSPLLWPDSEYNQSVAEFNRLFPGTDRLFVVLEGVKKDALKEPHLLENILAFQRYVERRPEVGGSNSIADLIAAMKQVIYEGNPRYNEIGDDVLSNGELLYLYVQGSNPGDIDYYTDVEYRTAGITFFLRDHRGQTLKSVIARMKEYIRTHMPEGARYRLAGGIGGVTAAVNEVIYTSQLKIAVYALLIILVTATITYRTVVAAFYLMVPIVLSSIITYAFMATSGIGLNINTLPVVALGVGLGVNYSIYVFDFIKESYTEHGTLQAAIHDAVHHAGRGVVLAALPLVVCALPWYFLSSLKFLSDMALLIAIWISISAASALFIIPGLVFILKPDFILSSK